MAAMERSLFRRLTLDRGGEAFAHYIEGFDLCTNGRNRCRGHDLAARAPWRRSQLGLSLLLAAGRDFHAPSLHASWILRGGGCRARLAPSCRRRQSGAGPDPLRCRRRTLVTGIDRVLASRLREFVAGPHWQRGIPAASDRRLRRDSRCDASVAEIRDAGA
jgi:hypothetical protein